MARLYENGAELQSTTNGVEWDTSTGAGASAFEIDTSTKRSGSASLKFTSSAAASRYFTRLFRSTSATEAVYMRFYIRVNQRPDVTIGIWQANDGATTEAAIGLRSDGALQLFDGDITGSSLGTSSVLSLNTWYRVELFADNGAGTELDARLDGTSFASGGTIAGEVDTIECGAIDWHTSTAAIFNIDDIAINDTTGTAETSWPGAGKLVLALPTGAGSSNPTKGVYSYINEIPPSDTATSGSTMIELDANPTNGDFNMTDSSTLGIPSDATIKYVSVWARIREETAGTSNYTLRIRSRSAGTVSSSSSLDAGNTTVRTNPSGTTNFGRWHRAYVIPQDGTSAWTATGTDSIDNMQVGVGTTDGNPDTWCLWLGAYIEYNPVELSQASFRFYEDGAETTSTAIDTQDTNITRDVSSGDSNLQLRVRLQNSGGAGASTDDYQLQYELNDSGNWADIDTTSGSAFTFGTTNTGVGQAFTGDGNSVSTASFYLKKNNSPTGNATAVLYAITGTYGTSAKPNGAALATSDNFDVSTLTTSYGWIDLTFSSPYTTVAGTKYFIAFEYSGADATNNINAEFAGDTCAGNYSFRQSGVWYTAATDIKAKVNGSTLQSIIGYNSASLTDGNATTNRLGSGSGSFVAGGISEDGLVDNLQITASNYTELLYSLTIESTAVADNDTLDFRVLRNGAVIDTYTVTPRITIEETAGVTIITNDIAISLTEDATTISQDHVISSADITNSLTTDNDTITQDHVIATQDVAISLTTDNTTIIENYTVAPDDTAISLTTDNTTISQNHIFSPDDIAFSLTEDNDTIAQNHIIDTQDVAVSLTTDNTTINQNHVIAGDDVAISLTEDNTTVEETNFILATQDVANSLTIDNATITQNHIFSPDDIAFSLTEDNDTISQDHVIVGQDIAISLTEDNVIVTDDGGGTVEILTDDTAIALTADATTITQNHVFAPDDIAFSLTQDNDTISQNHVIATQDVALSLTTDNDTILQDHLIVTQDALVSLSEDSTTIEQNHVIASGDALVSLTTDNTTVDESVILSTADITHSLSLDNTTISQNHVFSPDDIAFTLSEDSGTISQNHIIATDDIAISLTGDNTTISQNHLLSAVDIAIETRLDTGYAFDGTTQPSRSYYIDSNGDVYWVINQSIGLVEKV